MLSDGSLLIGSAYAGPPAYLLKLDSAGNIDSAFMPAITGGAVRGSIVLPDGRILIYGDFGTLSGVAHSCIGRLTASPSGGTDSSSQGSFTSAITPSVVWVGRLPDGSLIAAGRFDHYEGLSCNPHVCRLTADGVLDVMFNSGGAGVTGSTPEVSAAALQVDGKILIGGSFTRCNSVDCRGVARLNADGSLDTSFNPTGYGASFAVVGVAAITVQPDGRILIGGDFTTYNGYSRCGIARIWD